MTKKIVSIKIAILSSNKSISKEKILVNEIWAAIQLQQRNDSVVNADSVNTSLKNKIEKHRKQFNNSNKKNIGM